MSRYYGVMEHGEIQIKEPSVRVQNQNWNSNQLGDDDLEQGYSYPEKRLWAAVISQFLNDYKDTLKSIAKAKPPVNLHFKRVIEALRRETESELFNEMCEYVDLNVYHLKRKLDRLDEEHNLHSVIFTDVATSLTPWQARGKVEGNGTVGRPRMYPR